MLTLLQIQCILFYYTASLMSKNAYTITQLYFLQFALKFYKRHILILALHILSFFIISHLSGKKGNCLQRKEYAKCTFFLQKQPSGFGLAILGKITLPCGISGLTLSKIFFYLWLFKKKFQFDFCISLIYMCIFFLQVLVQI